MIPATIDLPADIAERVLINGMPADDAAWLSSRHLPDPATGLRRHGISSDALAWHAAAGRPISDREAPSDPSDLAACYLTWAAAPDHRRPAMHDTLHRWAAHVGSRYDLTELVDRLAHLGPLPGITADGRPATDTPPTDRQWVNPTLRSGNPACAACRNAGDWCADHVPH